MENNDKKTKNPTHNVLIGENRQVGKQIRTYWTTIGAAWAHEDGKMFLRIRDGLSVSGQVAIFPVKEKVEGEAPAVTEVQE